MHEFRKRLAMARGEVAKRMAWGAGNGGRYARSLPTGGSTEHDKGYLSALNDIRAVIGEKEMPNAAHLWGYNLVDARLRRIGKGNPLPDLERGDDAQ